MSKNNNVNPAHYKVGGRERQGEDVVHEIEKQKVAQQRAGISNRLSPRDEAKQRQQHPPVDTSSPPPEDARGRVGEQPLDDRRDRHTSHKAGSRSIAQKEAGARYPDRSMPPSRNVSGAFGREPGNRHRAQEASSHPSKQARGR
jgi:hypothetical protein